MAADLNAVTKFFLDRAEVARRVAAGQLRTLAKFGAFVRRSARSSIRQGKGAAAPGQPPKSHRGDLRRLLFFGVDAAARSTVVGPVIFPQARPQSRLAQEVLEDGGTVTRLVAVPVAAGRRASGRQAESYRRLLRDGRLAQPTPATRAETFRYRGNPFMGPAFNRELTNPKLRSLLAGSVH